MKTLKMKTVLLVGAAVIHERKILLLKRAETKKFLPGYYDLPGGKVKEGEDPNQAVLRELEEETGLKGQILQPYNVWSTILNFNGAEEHIIEIDYLIKTETTDKILLSEHEHSKYIWVSQQDIPPKITPELKATIHKSFLASRDL
jgi:8-oxo-dGTP diphosphatase